MMRDENFEREASQEDPKGFEKLENMVRKLVKVRKSDLESLRAGEDLAGVGGDYEPVPVDKRETFLTINTGGPRPFGSPPDEPVTIDGEVPWELRDEEK